MKVKELFEVVKRPAGSTYSDAENAALKKDKENRTDNAMSDLVKLIKSNCLTNFKALATGKAIPLYRAVKSSEYSKVGEYYAATVKGRTSPRMSLTGTNILMNYVSQAWKQVPKRDASAFCAVDYDNAVVWGDATWIVIPFDNVKSYAISPTDFNVIEQNDGGDDLLSMMRWFQEFIEYAREAIQYLKSRDKRSDLQNKLIKLLSLAISEYSSSKHFTLAEISSFSDDIETLIRFSDDYRDEVEEPKLRNLFIHIDTFEDVFSTRSFSEWLETEITPNKLGVKVYNSYSSIKSLGNDSEVWFEGDYLCIRAEPGSDQSTEQIPNSEFIKRILAQL